MTGQQQHFRGFEALRDKIGANFRANTWLEMRPHDFLSSLSLQPTFTNFMCLLEDAYVNCSQFSQRFKYQGCNCQYIKVDFFSLTVWVNVSKSQQIRQFSYGMKKGHYTGTDSLWCINTYSLGPCISLTNIFDSLSYATSPSVPNAFNRFLLTFCRGLCLTPSELRILAELSTATCPHFMKMPFDIIHLGIFLSSPILSTHWSKQKPSRFSFAGSPNFLMQQLQSAEFNGDPSQKSS